MKFGLGSIGGSWGITLLMEIDTIPIPEELKVIEKFIPLIVLSVGSIYGGHRITKKRSKK